MNDPQQYNYVTPVMVVSLKTLSIDVEIMFMKYIESQLYTPFYKGHSTISFTIQNIQLRENNNHFECSACKMPVNSLKKL